MSQEAAPHELLSEEELRVYLELKRRELALTSPMEYGVYCSRMERFPHVAYVDSLIMAALDGRLYKSGPSTTRCVFEPDESRPNDPLEGRWVHPTTREPAIFNISLNEPPRHGKQILTNEPVLTTKGWKNHGDLNLGDYIYAPNGQIIPVLANYGTKVNEPKLRVTFTDHTYVDCHPNHEWQVYTRKTRTVNGKSIGTEVYEAVEAKNLYTPKGRSRHLLPLTKSLTGDHHLSNPYTLGIWLGDGNTKLPLYCGSREDTYRTAQQIESEGVIARYQTTHKDTGVVYTDLIGAELPLGNKHISDFELTAYTEDRRSLLQGLVDSDGNVEPRSGRVRYVGKNKELVQGVVQLARTLGYRATLESREDNRPDRKIKSVGTFYVAQWTPHDGYASGRLPRKVGPRRVFTPRRVGVMSVTPAPPGDGNCIAVEGGVYLVGKDLIPTHNSFHISEHFPAWFLTTYPDLNFHLASYEDTFAATWGAKARDLVREHSEFGVEVRKDAKASRNWRILHHRGEMKTAGAGGPITGMGRHVGVIDDLVKNAEEAMSKVVQTGNVDWYLSTWKTRREPHPARMRSLYPDAGFPDVFCIDVSVSTRWNMGDLTGWLRENEADEWYFVNMPALAFDNPKDPEYGDPQRCVLSRQPGDPLCAPRFNRTQLLDLKTGSGEGLFWFNALYQGVPRVAEGGIIQKPFRYYKVGIGEGGTEEYHLDNGQTHNPYGCLRFATVDLAATLKTRSDYTVCAIWDVTPAPDRLLLLRARFRMKIESSEHESWIRRWDKEFSPTYMGIEDRTFGTTLIQNLRKHGGIRVKALPADKDKLTRALPFGYLVSEGKVFFPEDAPWLEEWEEELVNFPNGIHDDQVDVAAYAALEYENLPKHISKESREPVTIEDKVVAYKNRIIREKHKRRVRRVRYR